MLAEKLLIDVIAAILSAGCTSPFISIIDKAIFANASGSTTILKSVIQSTKYLVSTPRSFFTSPSFLWIWYFLTLLIQRGVYSGTYIVANSTESIFKHLNKDYVFPKFVTSSAANVGLSLAKDRYFTRAFGKGKVRPVPLRSLACYGTRDSMTILASFVLPKHVSDFLEPQLGKGRAVVASQLLTPCLMQFLSTPLHLYGMDFYNDTSYKGFRSRMEFIRREYIGTVCARIGRILPAFGIGSLVNIRIKETFSK